MQLEPLEERRLLTVAVPSLATGTTLSGAASPDFLQATLPNHTYYWPQAMQGGYNDNNIYFGSAAGNGAGQTIAIVDAYDDPDVAGDLQQFDATYGLPNPTFTKVDENGGNNLPGVDPAGAGPSVQNWEVEESLDVEWAHAMAPGASIVLVEAASNSTLDLFKAAQTAATLGSVVSMSFTTDEYSGETTDDSNFQAPGVTFVGSTGDTGAPGGFPAFSPDVVAVGGTDMQVNGSLQWNTETAWDDTGGGISQFETAPTYQTDGMIAEYNSSGSPVNSSLITGQNHPSAVVVTGGDVFVVNSGSGTVSEYTTSGATVNASLITGLNNPTGIAISSGDIFVTNSGSGTIGEYTTAGATVNASLVTGLNSPTRVSRSRAATCLSPIARESHRRIHHRRRDGPRLVV